MSRNQLAVTISGGSVEENQQMTSIVFAALTSCGFNNVSVNPMDLASLPSNVSVFDAVRSMNPELYDTPIVLNSETDDDLRHMESSALNSMAGYQSLAYAQ